MSSQSGTKSLFWGCLLGAVVTLGASSVAAADEQKRFPFDKSAVQRLEVVHPHAAELFKQGEQRVREADFRKAAELFEKVMLEAPENGLAHRRHCQALLELGRRPEALAACQRALATGGSPMDERAMVGAMMLGSETLTADEIAQAIHYAELAKERLHDQPWGYAADCDIARRLRNEPAYKSCLDTLAQVVPGHYETIRAIEGAPRSRAWLRWIGWALFGALLAFTAAHAARRRIRGLPRRAAGAAATLFLGSLALSPRASAQESGARPSSPPAPSSAAPADEHWQLSRWHINYDDPESSVPTPAQRNTNPLEFGYHLQDLAAEAKMSEDKGDHRRAVKFWRALAKAVPDSNAGFFRACGSYEKLGEREKAIEYCGKGLTLPPEYHPREASRYATLVLAKEGRLTSDEIADLDEVTGHLRASKQPLAAYHAEQIQCELALKLGDEPRLANCSGNLAKLAPKDPRTISYSWALAMKRQDFAAAKGFVTQARAAAMKPEAIAELERAIDLAVSERRGQRLKLAAGIAAGLLLLAVGIVALRRAIARRRPSQKAPVAPGVA